MGLEAADYPPQLIATNPLPADNQSQGDDHLRLLKNVFLKTFPNVNGAITLSHTDINASVAAALAAATAAGATAWIAGNYTAGQCVYSPINYQTYRSKSTFTSATDPSLDTEGVYWQKLTGSATLPDFLLQAQGII